jgi:hypothetical protein
MFVWWDDVRVEAGFPQEINFEKIDAQRVERGLLPILAIQHELAGPPAEELYILAPGRGKPYWLLKPEYADLVHNNPYRAPYNLKELYIKLVAKRMKLD